MNFMDKRLVSDTSLSEETRARIASVQKRLEESGVVNIRFSWNYEQLAKDLPALEDVANKVCAMLESDLDGEWSTIPPFDDKPT